MINSAPHPHPAERRFSRRLRILIAALAGAFVLGGVGAALAYWLTSDASSPAGALADSLPQGATPTGLSASGSTVTFSFAQTSTAGGLKLDAYTFRRSPGSGQQTVVTATCVGPSSAGQFTCTESNVPDGTWTYTDQPVIAGTNWVGSQSTKSASVTVDTTTSVAFTTATGPLNMTTAGAASSSGSGENGATVVVVLRDTGNAHATVPATAQVTNGTWTVSGIDASGLSDGNVTYTATATDTFGNVATATRAVLKDTVSPTIALSTVTDPITGANKSSVGASGTGENGATVSVVVKDAGNLHATSVATGTISSATWSVSGINASTLNDGTVTYTATATDAAGNTATTSSTASKDTTAPAVAFTSVTNPVNLANRTAVSASGTAETGAGISVVVRGGGGTATTAVTTTAVGGSWSVSGIDASSLADGTITYSVTATDAVGNATTATQNATKDTLAPTVVLSTALTPITSSNKTSVSASGSSSSASSVSVVVSDGIHTTTPAADAPNGSGSWSVSGINASSLDDGPVTYTATATDAAGNTASSTKSAVKDTVAQVGITTVTNPVTAANKTNVAANGTTETGATVSVVVSNGAASVTKAATVVGTSWSVSNIDVSGLADGTLTWRANVTDAVSNTGSASTTGAKDTATQGTISTVTDPVTSANKTNVGASGTNEAGATVSVTVSNGSSTATKAATVSGTTWSVSGIDVSTLSDGTITYAATVTDGVGNTATATKTAAKDTTAQVAITTVTNPVTASNKANVAANGTTESGATVSVAVNDGSHSVSKLAAVVGTSWSVSGIDVSTLNEGTITFIASATDPAGNTGSANATATKDTTAPAVNVTLVTQTISSSNASNVSASGTGEEGAAISVVVTDAASKSTTAKTTTVSGGVWMVSGIDATGLADGSVTYTVTAKDAAQNSATAAQTATKDTVTQVAMTSVPAYVNLANRTNVQVSGTGENGATVQVVIRDANNVHSTTAVSAVVASGTWSVSGIDASSLNDGAVTYTATATDGAGNTASATAQGNKDTVAPTVKNVTLANAGNANNAGALTGGDTVTITYSEPIDPTKFCSTWTSPYSLSGSGVVVTVTDAGGSNSDVLTVTAGGCTLQTGSVAVGDYVSATATFFGTGGNSSKVAWDGTSKLTITVGTKQTGGVNSGVAAGTPTYTPSSGLTDLAGNPLLTTPFTDPASSRF